MKKHLMLMSLSFLLLIYPPCISYAEEVRELGELVITPSRMAMYDYRISSDVTVIDSEEIAASNAQTVAEILQQKPGVNIYDNSTYKSAIIDIRGFGDTASRNVLVLINDRKVNAVDVSGTDLMQIPLGSVEKIEIMRGSASVLYGDNAVGGVVNIITKKGKGDLSGRAGLTWASYETLAEDVEIDGEFKDFNYYFYSKYSDSDGYRRNSGIRSKDFDTRIGYEGLDKLKIDVNAGWHEDDNGLPGGLNEAELAGSGRRGSADPRDYASTKDRYVQVALDFRPWTGEQNYGHFLTDFSYRNRDTIGVFAAFDFGTKREIDTYGLTTKYIYDQEIFDHEVNFITGLDYYNTENDITGTGSNTDDITISKEEVGAYSFGEFEAFEKFFVNVGTRFHKAFYTFDQRSGTPSVVKQNPYESVSTAGIKYEYATGSNIFAVVEQSFRFLATDEWYSTFSGLNTSLTQQTGLQYEAGLKHHFGDVTVVGLSAYLMDLKDEIFFDPTAGPFGFGQNSNYDKTRRIGIEVDQSTDIAGILDVDFIQRLEIYANYTYQNPEFVDGASDGKQIPMAPEHQVSAGLRSTLFEHFRASLVGRYVGERYAINDTLNVTPQIKPYLVFDGKLAFRWDPVEVIFSVNNITDEKYFTFVAKAASSTIKDHYPAPERNYGMTVNIRF